MRHTELRTTPRDHEIRVKKGHDKKHERHDIVRHAETEAPERHAPMRLHDLFESMERLMEEAWHRPSFGFGLPLMSTLLPEWRSRDTRLPVTDVYEEGGVVVVKSELPGMTKEDVSVSLEGDRLTIRGERKSEERTEEKDYVRLERSHGRFERILTLPDGLDLDNVTATMKDGLLEVRIPRSRSETARTITVT